MSVSEAIAVKEWHLEFGLCWAVLHQAFQPNGLADVFSTERLRKRSSTLVVIQTFYEVCMLTRT